MLMTSSTSLVPRFCRFAPAFGSATELRATGMPERRTRQLSMKKHLSNEMLSQSRDLLSARFPPARHLRGARRFKDTVQRKKEGMASMLRRQKTNFT
jgi:hypothetical protein